MASKGSVAAPLRKHELLQLEQMIQPLTPSAGQNSYVRPDLAASNLGAPLSAGAMNFTAEDHRMLDDSTWDLFLSGTTVGLSQRELMDLAGQLDMYTI